MQIDIRQSTILDFEGDGIIVPTVSTGEMEIPPGSALRPLAGDEVEAAVRAHAPIAVGACLVTGPGALRVRHLIHAPVVEEASMRIGIENIRRCVRAGLLGATRYELALVAIPGFGYGENGVSHDETARAIIDEITGYKAPHPSKIVLMDPDEDMYDAFAEIL